MACVLLFLADEQEQRPDPFSNLQTLKYVEKGFYPPLSVGVSPNSVHRPTDMSRELSTVTTAARARPHLDFTMSILPARKKKKISAYCCNRCLFNYSFPRQLQVYTLIFQTGRRGLSQKGTDSKTMVRQITELSDPP
uniref:Uncharacterized protein n=1 Tax=Oreochromis niloticus TaxID=8128 RepID=A0A669C0B0_ORENI